MSTGRLPSTDGGIQPTVVDAKGDLLVGVAADSISRLAVGSNDQVLTADSTTATGLKWATPSSGATSWSLINTGGTSLTGAATITISGITKNSIAIYVWDASSANANSDLYLRVNSDSTSKYGYGGLQMRQTTSYTGSGFASTVNGDGANINSNDKFLLVALSGNASASSSGFVEITGATGSGPKFLKSSFGNTPASTGTDAQARVLGGIYTGSSAITSVSIISSSGNFDNGTIYVYEG